ncbi:MAG: dicarboxylate/amino acid:cation symporter [Simkaniaceae bacterium]|nr:dicarboxylate/amino acid:cation symporter [Candidatus Sacchlamyda saccharinae]
MTQKKRKKPWAVFIAIALAIFIGDWTGKEAGLFGVSFYSIYDIVGKLFINSLTLIIVPLVSSSIITGVARIGGDGQFGRIGLKTFSFYFLTKIIAIIIGIVIINLIHPGTANIGTASSLISTKEIAINPEAVSASGAFVKMLEDLIPPNVLDAFAKGNMLGLIFFSIIFGYAITHISKKAAETHMNFWSGIFEATINITHYIMKVLPIGVFCLVAKVFAETGLSSLRSVGLFFFTVLLGLAIFVLIALPLLLKFVAKVNPWNQFRAMAPALITAFSTSSSSAALPITLECMEKRAGISNRICSLVIPLGTSINLTGSALYEGMAALYVAQSFGLELSIGSQFLFTFITLITSIGIASIPSGSLIIIMIILRFWGLPAEGIGLFLAVDRILDMFRSVTNLFADGCCAVFVAKSEGETNILTKKEFEPI